MKTTIKTLTLAALIGLALTASACKADAAIIVAYPAGYAVSALPYTVVTAPVPYVPTLIAPPFYTVPVIPAVPVISATTPVITYTTVYSPYWF